MRGLSRSVAGLWRRWGGRTFLSIADQGLVSGSTFLVSILLARWLLPSGYGAYAIAYSIFLFISGFHNALVLEPMSVLGPARYKQLPVEYLANLMITHAGVSVGSSTLTAATGLVLSRAGTPVAGPLLGLAIGSPAILTYWLLRRICYQQTRPDLALWGSLTHGLVLAAGLAVARWRGWVSPFSVFLILGLSSAGASLLLWGVLKPGALPLSWARVKSAIPQFLSQHWQYAKWVLGSAFVFWLSSVVYMPLVGSFAGLEAAGVWQAMENLLKPLQNVLTAFGLLLLPWVSRQRASRGAVYANRIMLWVLAAILVAACAYLVPLAAARRWLVRMLYGERFYDGFVWLLPLLGAAAFIGALLQGLTIWVKGFERPNVSFWSQAAGTALTLSIGIYLVWRFHLAGAAAALILVRAAMTLVVAHYLSRLAGKHGESG